MATLPENKTQSDERLDLSAAFFAQEFLFAF